ncbi:sterol-4-alpha-carboxylate 3-dehydrogenase [Cercophora newfieldiana]|uniref:Sterol-4-alpha-carboxylate 3-dehydrogenase n=1 Tax=Cercophora newfieldiana TaxID=92897 RepID=A0AA40CUT7_9PEZI|nr:sterol-4-alpha-carboxylate 3-dehydrogenase [Cercophora newfieldiana]
MATSGKTRLGSVAVIGGAGFLGHHIVKELLADPTVTSISVMSRNPFKNRFEDERLWYMAGDITVPANVEQFLMYAKPDVIINTASPVAYIDHIHAHEYEDVNVDGNRILLRAANVQKGVKAYIYTSSGPIIAGAGGAYEQADETRPTLAETAKNGAGDAYHIAKARGDALVLAANDRSPGGIRTATIRPTAMYGEGDQQMIANLLSVHRAGQQNVWLGDNTALMDSVYVGSVARAHILAAYGILAGLEDPNAPKVDGEAFNITDDAPLPPWTFFRLFWIEMGDTTPLSKVWMIPNSVTLAMSEIAEWWTWATSLGKYRPKVLIKERIEFLLYTRTYSIAKARERLGYEPVISMQEAVRRAVKWALLEWPEESTKKEC